MIRRFSAFLVFLGVLSLSPVFAADVVVKAAIAVDKDTRPATVFASDTPKLYAFFKSEGTEDGDEFRAAWIAEDTGGVAPANFKIDEAVLKADDDDYFGAFSLSKPNNGWPVGKYRVDIFLNGKLVTTAPFSIK